MRRLYQFLAGILAIIFFLWGISAYMQSRTGNVSDKLVIYNWGDYIDPDLLTKFTKETKLYNSDVLSALRAMEGKYRFDIIFMDPPYKQELEYDVLSYLKDSSLLKENGIIIVEASLDTAFDYLPDMGFTLKRLKTYKTNEHAFIIKNQ